MKLRAALVPTTGAARPYVGRFAPSPTGPLHEGSLVAALASWLDARAQAGQWLVRIEDIDPPREAVGATDTILWQLARCGLEADKPPVRQSMRSDAYREALDRLTDDGWAYPCACSRKEIADASDPVAPTYGNVARLEPSNRFAVTGRERVYRNTCRNGLHGREARAMRLRVANASNSETDAAERVEEPIFIVWQDRRLGGRHENLTSAVGDFVLKRADGLWAYQLAVVVDDAARGITDVVRGEDLAASTARQIYLQRRLGVPTPRYLHTPLVLGADGEKLSKQNGAEPLQLDGAHQAPLEALRRAGRVLGIASEGTSIAEWLGRAVPQWRARWPLGSADRSPAGGAS